MTDQKSVCLQAHDLVTDDRAEQYGSALITHAKAVEIFQLIFPRVVGINRMEIPVPTQTKKDDALSMMYSMVALKLARQAYKPKRDNLVDICGYLQLISEIEASE